MSDISRAASCKSPQASPTPLPVRPPQGQEGLPSEAAGPEGILDKVEIEVDAEVEYCVSSPEPPTSPRSVLTIVQAFGKKGLADNVAQRLAGTAVDKLLKKTTDQQDTIGKLQNEVFHLRAQHAPTPVIQRTITCPQGFIRNTGTLGFTVPYCGGRA